jgi:hypothetical protein
MTVATETRIFTHTPFSYGFFGRATSVVSDRLA